MSTNKTFNKVQLDVKFTQATSRANLTSEENISISFGKLSKWYASLVPTGGSSGQFLGWNSDGTAKWVSNPNSDTKLTQTNTTTSADYRVLLSGNANDTTETTTGHKSNKLRFNPSSGGLYSFGFLWTDITGSTLDINTLTLSDGTPHSRRFIEKTDGGAGNITNIPVTGHPFLLEVDLIRWASTTDYITRQRFTNAANGTYSYVRYCTNGTWGSWTTRKYTDTNTKVTSSANHYTPATVSGEDKSASASGATAAWNIDVVKGITLNTDGKGHVTGLSVTSGKIPANPVPSNNVTGSGTSGYLTKWNGTNAITNGPQLGSSTTTYLRNDGTWAIPTDTNTTYTIATGDSNGQIKVTPSSGSVYNVSVKGLGTAAYKASSDFAVSQTLANDTNLNNITTPGFYNCGGTNSVTNKPSNVDAFGLNVIHDASGQWYTQILYPNNASPLIYVRNYNGSAWSGWNSIAIGSFLPLSGGTMTGQLKTSFKESVAVGSYQAQATKIPDLCTELRYSSGAMGSVALTEAYTKDGITIAATWYNFIWIPHRSGGVNGAASGDNCNYGSLILSGMTGSGAFIIRYANGSIAELKYLYKDTTYSANNGVGLSGTTFYNSGVRAVSTGSANGTISVNTNGTSADVSVKGLASAAYVTQESLLRARSTVSTDGGATGWSQIGINQYNGAYPDGVTNKIYSWGAVVSIPAPNARFDLYYNHNSSTAGATTNGLQYRTGWDNDKKAWRMLLDSGNYTSYALAATTKYAASSSVGGPALSVSTAGGNVVLGTPDSSSDDSGDIVWEYGNGQEKARIYLLNTYTAKEGPLYRIFKSDGTGLYSGRLPLADGTSASGTWGISITGSAASWTTARTLTLSGQLTGSVSVKGDANMTLNGYLDRAFIYDGNAVPDGHTWAEYAWHKFAEVTITNTWTDCVITFLVSRTYGNSAENAGILSAKLRTNGSKAYDSAQLKWLVRNSGLSNNDFVMVYTSTSGTSTKAELWCRIPTQYSGLIFTVLKEHLRHYSTNTTWTLVKTPDATGGTHGSSSYPTTGITGTIISSDGTITNSTTGTATSANALNLTHGNELNFSKLASTGHVWFGYRWNTQGTETSGGTTITTYKFGNANGAGGLAGLEATTSTFKSGNFGDQLIVERTGGANMAGITFKNTSGVLGYIAANTVDGDLYHYGATDPSTMQYTILDSHNYTSYPLPRNIKHIHTASGTEGSAGWVKIARITVTNLYANHPMTFTIAQRGLMQYRIHLVLVNNGSVAAAAISQFIIARDNSWTDTNNNPRAYIIKPSDGIFDLYIRKTEAYDHIFVVDFTKADNNEGDNYSVTWTNVHAADSAITGGTEAVKKLYLPTTTNYAGSSSAGGDATNANAANVTVTDVPSTSTSTDAWKTSYGILFAQNPNTTQSNTLRKSHNLRFYHGPNGTANTVGVGELIVGNNTASGTAGNMQGRLILYSSSSSYITMVPAATSSARTITLPAATGSVILGTKGSTSFWGLMDGDASTANWIRATSNGFIPSAGAKFFQTATSSLGTNTWYFKNSYIQYMNANRLVLGAAKTADGAAKGQLKFFSGNGSDATGTVTLECADDAVHTGDYTVKLPTWNGTIPVFEKLFEGASNTVSLSYSDIDEYDVFLITVANSNATSEQVTVTSLWISNVAGIHDMPLIWGGAPTSSGGSCNVTSGWIQLSKNSGTTTFVVAHKPNVAQMTSSGWTISSPTYNLYIRKIFGLKAFKRT